MTPREVLRFEIKGQTVTIATTRGGFRMSSQQMRISAARRRAFDGPIRGLTSHRQSSAPYPTRVGALPAGEPTTPICPDCNEHIERNLKQHMAGERCACATAARELIEQGQLEIGQRAMLRPYATPHPTRVVPGGPGRRQKVQTRYWAPAALVHEYDRVKHLPVNEAKAALAKVAEGLPR